jgi:hypothetical protein
VQRFGSDRWDTLVEVVKGAARDISLQMGYNTSLVERLPVASDAESVVASGSEGDNES